MTTPTGKSTLPEDAMHVLTHSTVQVSVGSADIAMSTYFNCGYCRRIFFNAAGIAYLQRDGDSAPVAYNVPAGTYIDGIFSLIGGTSNAQNNSSNPVGSASSGLVLNLEI